MKLTAPEWFVFTILVNAERVGLNRMLSICNELGIPNVPIEEVGVNLPANYPDVEALLKRAEGEYPCGSRKEGIVIRPLEPVYSPLIGDYLSIKVVNNKYLLK